MPRLEADLTETPLERSILHHQFIPCLAITTRKPTGQASSRKKNTVLICPPSVINLMQTHPVPAACMLLNVLGGASSERLDNSRFDLLPVLETLSLGS